MSIIASCGHALHHNSELALIARKPNGAETVVELYCKQCAMLEEIEGRALVIQNVKTGREGPHV